jgi:hypothetical protein
MPRQMEWKPRRLTKAVREKIDRRNQEAVDSGQRREGRENAYWNFRAQSRFEQAGVKVFLATEWESLDAVRDLMEREPGARWCIVSPEFQQWILRDFDGAERAEVMQQEHAEVVRRYPDELAELRREIEADESRRGEGG